MPMIGFKKEFAKAVATGQKKQTVRRVSKKIYTVGDPLVAYSGLRTKQVKKLMESTITRVEKFLFYGPYTLVLDGKLLSDSERNAFAKKDGFDDFISMRKWFSDQYENLYTQEFQVIHWE